MHVLLLESEKALGQFIKRGLEREGYEVVWSADGLDGLQQTLEIHPDLLLLDVPQNTPALLDRLRERFPDAAIIVLCGCTEVSERVRCLDLGADDCLPKPFHLQELVARCRALQRRRLRISDTTLKYGGLELNRASHCVLRGQQMIELTAKESALLECLLVQKGRLVSRDELLRQVWHTTSHSRTNIIEVYINYLRRKLEADPTLKEESLIETVRGEGYRIRCTPEVANTYIISSSLN